MPFIVFLLLAFSACTTHKQHAGSVDADPFTLINASAQSWIAGHKDGGSGTEYSFTIKLMINGKVTFDSLWVNNKPLAIFTAKNISTVSNAPVTYSKGDTIILRATDLSNLTDTVEAAPYKSARLRYFRNAMPIYYLVEPIKIKKPLHLPIRN